MNEQRRSLVEAPNESAGSLPPIQSQSSSPPFAFGILALQPQPTDPPWTMQRADEVNSIQRMLSDPQTSTVFIVGTPGAGKSTLAALLFQRVKLAQQAGIPSPRHLVWLEIGTYTTLPDLIAAILRGVGINEPGFHLMRAEQQIALLQSALKRPQEGALIVLDQFETMLHPETNQGIAGRGVLPLFLQLLQTDLNPSRFLLTSYASPFGQQNMVTDEVTHVRSYLVSRISMPEGVAFLQQRGVQGSPEELSLVWQRCLGHIFALTLFSALANLSGISLSYMLNSPDYKPLWSNEVLFQLITAVLSFLNPAQYSIVKALSLFYEPVPIKGLVMTVAGTNTTVGQEYTTRFERELSVLTRLSLVKPAADCRGEPGYTLHPLLRQYILEYYTADTNRHPTANGQIALGASALPPNPSAPDPAKLRSALMEAHGRVANYYQITARRYCPPREKRQGLQDIQYIISAIRHLYMSGAGQQACELLFEEGLHESMVQWGAWNALIGLYTALLPPFSILIRRDEGRIASLVGMLYGRMSEHSQSQAYLEQALTIQRQIGDIKGEITTLINQGELLRWRGGNEQARKNFERAQTLNALLHDVSFECILRHNLGLLFHAEKNYRAALDHYTWALRLSRDTLKHQNEGTILMNLGMLLFEQGMQVEGMALLLSAMQVRQAQHDPDVAMLQYFLNTLEYKMGTQAYRQLCQAAMMQQQAVLSRFTSPNVRQ